MAWDRGFLGPGWETSPIRLPPVQPGSFPSWNWLSALSAWPEALPRHLCPWESWPRGPSATAAHLHVAGMGRPLGRRSPGERAGRLVTRAGDRRVSSLCGLRQTLVPAVGRGGGTSCCPLAQPLRCFLEAWPVCRPHPGEGSCGFLMAIRAGAGAGRWALGSMEGTPAPRLVPTPPFPAFQK